MTASARTDGSPTDRTVAPGAPAGCPTGRVSDLRTHGALPVHIRPIRPDDEAGLLAFHQRLSPLSVYRRYFSAHPELSTQEVRRLTHVDYVDRLALVAESAGEIVAVCRYERLGRTLDAEVAFLVSDEHQHHGIASALLQCLAAAARDNGITTFVAETLADNRAMLDVFADSGFPLTTSRESGTVSLRFPITGERPVPLEAEESVPVRPLKPIGPEAASSGGVPGSHR